MVVVMASAGIQFVDPRLIASDLQNGPPKFGLWWACFLRISSTKRTSRMVQKNRRLLV
jgi:hypothetical protein